jgi:hypothetical protein
VCSSDVPKGTVIEDGVLTALQVATTEADGDAEFREAAGLAQIPTPFIETETCVLACHSVR